MSFRLGGEERYAYTISQTEEQPYLDVDPATRQILKREDVVPPPHQPGLLPPWLAERGVKVVIAGGMGQRAVALFNQQGIQVHVGAPAAAPADRPR